MKGIHRRRFIAGLAAAGTGSCLCGAGGCSTFSKVGSTPAIAAGAYAVNGRTVTITLGKTPELGSIGGAVKVIDPSLPEAMIIARTGEAEYAAVSLHCTHRGVELEYRHDGRQFRCASLGHSRFDTGGVRLTGPARRSLRKFAVTLNPEGRAHTLQIVV